MELEAIVQLMTTFFTVFYTNLSHFNIISLRWILRLEKLSEWNEGNTHQLIKCLCHYFARLQVLASCLLSIRFLIFYTNKYLLSTFSSLLFFLSSCSHLHKWRLWSNVIVAILKHLFIRLIFLFLTQQRGYISWNDVSDRWALPQDRESSE